MINLIGRSQLNLIFYTSSFSTHNMGEFDVLKLENKQ